MKINIYYKILIVWTLSSAVYGLQLWFEYALIQGARPLPDWIDSPFLYLYLMFPFLFVAGSFFYKNKQDIKSALSSAAAPAIIPIPGFVCCVFFIQLKYFLNL